MKPSMLIDFLSFIQGQKNECQKQAFIIKIIDGKDLIWFTEDRLQSE